jgi:hypothetical protein
LIHITSLNIPRPHIHNITGIVIMYNIVHSNHHVECPVSS